MIASYSNPEAPGFGWICRPAQGGTSLFQPFPCCKAMQKENNIQ